MTAPQDMLDLGTAATSISQSRPENEQPSQRTARRSLGSLLVEAGVATDEQIRQAMAESMQTGERLGEVVLRQGWTDDSGLARLLAAQWNLPFIESEALSSDQRALALFSAEDALCMGAVPISIEENRPVVAIAEPSEERLTAVNALLECDGSFVVVAKSELDRLLSRWPSPNAAEGTPPGGDLAGSTDGGDGRHATLLADLDATAARLVGLRANVERLTQTLLRREQELAEGQERLAAVSAAHEQELGRRRHLEAELERRGEHLSTTKAVLVELVRKLEDG